MAFRENESIKRPFSLGLKGQPSGAQGLFIKSLDASLPRYFAYARPLVNSDFLSGGGSCPPFERRS